MERDRHDLSTADLAGAPQRDEMRARSGEHLRGRALHEERPVTAAPDAPPHQDRQHEAPAHATAPQATAAPAGHATGTAALLGERKADRAEETLFPGDEGQRLRSRWTDIQAGFVDQPREAVRQADELVAQAMKRLAEVFAAERANLESQWDRGGSVTTEDLRVALQRYRAFFDRLLSV